MSMTTTEKIEHFLKRAQQEREAALRSRSPQARQAHLNLALEHERAAERERAGRVYSMARSFDHV